MKFYVAFTFVALSHFVTADNRLMSLGRSNASFESRKNRTLEVASVGRVTKFRLINANIGNRGQSLIDPLVNGTIVNLKNYPTGQKFSIEAVTSIDKGPVGSVQFMFAGDDTFQTETTPPFALCRDAESVFKPCSQLVVGKHTVAATPYSLASRTGTMGPKHSVSFSIVNTIITTKAPSLYPTQVPKSTPVRVPKSTPAVAPSSIPRAVPKSTPVKPPKSISSVAPVLAPATTPTTSKFAKWIEVNPKAPIDARHEACFVMVGRKAYLLAGRGRKSINVYDPESRIWTNGTSAPYLFHHTQCVAANDSIWIVSSWSGGYPREMNNDKIYVRAYISNLILMHCHL